MASPIVVKPVVVVEAPNMTLTECFGNVANQQSFSSLASVVVTQKSEAVFQTPLFEEYVICTEGNIDIVHGVTGSEITTRVSAGQGVYMAMGLRSKFTWPEGGAKFTALCFPAFSPDITRPDVDGVSPVADLDASLRPQIFEPVNVVDAPGITITERFGHVSSGTCACSLATAIVGAAAEEAYQAPGFDEWVYCTEGSIDFVHAGGTTHIAAGEAAFLPKDFRVKWIWPEATKYTVVCSPAFTPELSGREAEEAATVAKDSASMKRLEELHAAVGEAPAAVA